MSIKFMNALTGDVTPEVLGLPTTLHHLLGRGAYLFRFLRGHLEVNVHTMQQFNVTIPYIKQPVSFKIFFHDDLSHKMWFVDELQIELLSHLQINSPDDLITRTKDGKSVSYSSFENVHLSVREFWETWLQPELDARGRNYLWYHKLSLLIATDIMHTTRITRRNILQEMSSIGSVKLYISLDQDNYVHLRLMAPCGDVVDNSKASRLQLENLILSLPLPD